MFGRRFVTRWLPMPVLPTCHDLAVCGTIFWVSKAPRGRLGGKDTAGPSGFAAAHHLEPNENPILLVPRKAQLASRDHPPIVNEDSLALAQAIVLSPCFRHERLPPFSEQPQSQAFLPKRWVF
jgi:hypothetical protein